MHQYASIRLRVFYYIMFFVMGMGNPMGPHSPLGGGFGEILSPIIYMGIEMWKLEGSGDGDVVGIPIGDCPHCHS
jgi:hypothetical protein